MHGLFWWQWWRARRRLGQWVRSLIGSRPYKVEFRTEGASYCDFSLGSRGALLRPSPI